MCVLGRGFPGRWRPLIHSTGVQQEPPSVPGVAEAWAPRAFARRLCPEGGDSLMRDVRLSCSDRLLG